MQHLSAAVQYSWHIYFLCVMTAIWWTAQMLMSVVKATMVAASMSVSTHQELSTVHVMMGTDCRGTTARVEVRGRVVTFHSLWPCVRLCGVPV